MRGVEGKVIIETYKQDISLVATCPHKRNLR